MSSIFRTISGAPSTPPTPAAPPPPVTPVLVPGKPIDAYILIHQLTYLLTTFLATVQYMHTQPSGRGILQKNLMFRYSSEANILLACARELVSKYTSNIDLGQLSCPFPTLTTPAASWNLSTSFPGFARVLSVTRGDPKVLYGKSFASRFQTHGAQQHEDGNEQGKVQRAQFFRPPASLGLSQAEHQRISSALCAQYAIWNNAIDNFSANFNPLTPLGAVALMADTALSLRTSALAAIKLVEHDLRLALGLRPIAGTLEAKLVYMAIVKEAGKKGNLEARVKRELWEVCKEGERRWDELEMQELEEGDWGRAC